MKDGVLSLLSQRLRGLREGRGWTQEEVAKHSGLDRRTISYWENQESPKRPPSNTILKLSRAFNIKPEELYQAAGYIKRIGDFRPRPETPDEILDRLKIATPVAIPVYEDFPFHAGNSVAPIDLRYIDRKIATGKSLEGYRVHGDCLEPQINDGDIIIIDRTGEIVNGDIVACLLDNQLCVARLRKVAEELWLENNFGKIKFEDCRITAPVIEIRRRLK